MAWVWVPRLGKFVWKHRKKIQRAVSFEKTRRRVIKYRRKQIGKIKNKSKRGPGVAKTRPGRPKPRKTMRARLAPKPKMVYYRRGGCPPGYRYDPIRKMCIQNNYK